jgi:hypothetical protein
MRSFLLPAALSMVVHAAVIRGTVVENQTGRPLARALVKLEPVKGTASTEQSIRTNRYGAFEFQQLGAGAYLLTASRTGFATAQYGQKQWKSSGVPVPVGAEDSYTVSIRLWRFGSITGTVLDENDVGLPEHEVVAYRNTRPPQPAAEAKCDDRGVFRFYGLEPGSYLIRTIGKQYDEGNYLPTFAKETDVVDQSFPVEVNLDQQVDRVDVRPFQGRLFSLTIRIDPLPQRMTGPVTITLVSDMGRQTVQSLSHRFNELPPGQYEIFADAPVLTQANQPGMQGEYQRVTVGGDIARTLSLHPVPELQFTFEGAPGDRNMQVLARRKDLAGSGESKVLELANNRFQLAPGPWELAIPPNPAFYVSNFSGPRHERPGDGRAEGWNEIGVGYGSPLVRFTLSSNVGTVQGAVRSGGQPVVGAPVFLEPSDLDPGRRVTDTFVTRTDLRGQYQFTGLAPGNYRVLSSFEYKVADSAAMSGARATPVIVDAGHTVQQDLELYAIP